MRFLSTLLLLGGYILVYAGFANHGKFATEPWAGVFFDAYTEPPKETAKQKSLAKKFRRGQQQAAQSPLPTPLLPAGSGGGEFGIGG